MCNIQTMCFKVNICFFQNPYTIHILFSFWAATSTTVPMTFQLLKNCSLTLTITIWTLCLLPSARLIPHPSREIWTTIQPARKATQLLSCREDFLRLHYAYFVQRQLLAAFLFSILFIFDVAFCQLGFLHEYMMMMMMMMMMTSTNVLQCFLS